MSKNHRYGAVRMFSILSSGNYGPKLCHLINYFDKSEGYAHVPHKRILSFGIWVHTSDVYLWGNNV